MAAANGNCDASEARAQQIAAALAESERKLSATKASPTSSAHLKSINDHGAAAELNASLAAKSHEIYLLQDQLVQARSLQPLNSAVSK